MLRKVVLILVGVCLPCFVMSASAAGVKVSKQGWEMEAGSLGKVTLGYPQIGDGALAGPREATVDGANVSAKYANGSELMIEQQGEGVYRLHFQSVPDDVKKIRLNMTMPGSFKGKASWSIDGKPAQLLAEKYAGKPFLFQGDGKRFALQDAAGKGCAIIMPFGFQQLQDNREWKSDEFMWFVQADMPSSGPGEAYIQIKIADTAGGEPKEGVDAAGAPVAPVAAPVAAPETAAAAGPVAKNEKPKFVLTDKNLSIHAGTAGNFEMSLPALKDVKGGEPMEMVLAGDRKSLTYKFRAGGTAKLTLSGDDTVMVSFADLPAEAQKIRVETYIPLNYNSGGKYSVSGTNLQAFPKDKPASPNLYQGNVDTFSILHASGAGFAISGFEMGTFHQLQDNREWNWSVFFWFFETPLPQGSDTPSYTLKLSSPVGGTEKIKPLIDRFGQHTGIEFEGKVKTDAELMADVQADKEYYASLTPPALDRFGGLPGSGEKHGLKKTGFFHIEKIGQTQVMVDPDGNLFFQLGLCGLATPCDDYTRVRGRERIYEWLPSTSDPIMKTAWRENDPGVMSFYIANLVRKSGVAFEQGKFVSMWIDRARKWGFNSAGAFAGWNDAGNKVARASNLPYVSWVPIGGAAMGLPVNQMWDPFSDDIEAKLDAEFARNLTPQAKDPLIIGFFLVNEPAIEDIPKVIPGLKGSKFAAKRRLVQMFQEKYPTIEAFNVAWETKAQSFDELKDLSLAITTKAASADMQKYYELFLEQRYSLVHKYFRKHDPNHMLIGDRWMPGTANNEALVRTAGKYVDVLSINYYTYGIEKGFLDRIHAWSGGKPLILSEFYYGSRDQGLTGGARQITDQRERGLGYRNYVEQSAATGYVVGVQWFGFIDQAATGRFFEGFNGEAANIGMVNVADRPYKPFLAEAIKTNYAIYDVVLGKQKPYVFEDARFTMKGDGKKVVQAPRMIKPVALDGRRNEWPPVPPTRVGESGLVLGANAKDLEGTFRMAWDEKNLYVFAEVVDSTPMQNTQGNDGIWADDGLELFTGFDNLKEGGSLQFGDRQILIRGGKSDATHAAVVFVNAPRAYTAQTAVVSGTDGKSYTIEVAIPFEALGFVPKAGQEILFDLCVNDGHGGRRQLAWNGTAQDSKNRGVWGRAEFTE